MSSKSVQIENPEKLSVKAIIDNRVNGYGKPVSADAFQNMPEKEWSDLRIEATKNRREGDAVLICALCENRVYPRLSPNGTRHFYHFSSSGIDCPWSSSVGRRIHAVDAEKFRGRQEGEKHKSLCEYISNVLSIDTKTKEEGVSKNRFIKNSDGRHGFPDVYAERWWGSGTAFEVQLATTHVPVIERREAFYKDIGCRIVWILEFNRENLLRQSFKDIYMRNDGQALSMDREVFEVSLKNNAPHFRLIRIIPKITEYGISLKFASRIADHEQIRWSASGSGTVSKAPSFDNLLEKGILNQPKIAAERQKLYRSLESDDLRGVLWSWDKIAAMTNGKTSGEIGFSYDDMQVLRTLVALKFCRKEIAGLRYDINQLPAIVNSKILEPVERRHWTKTLDQFLESRGFFEVMHRKKVLEKRSRNYREHEPPVQFSAYAGSVLDVVLPEGAFARVERGAIDSAGVL